MLSSKDKDRLAGELAHGAQQDRGAGGRGQPDGWRATPLSTCLLTLPAFRAQLEVDVQRASRHSSSLSIAVIDLDDFRFLNAKHGFAAGDAVLVAVGKLIDREHAHL